MIIYIRTIALSIVRVDKGKARAELGATLNEGRIVMIFNTMIVLKVRKCLTLGFF